MWQILAFTELQLGSVSRSSHAADPGSENAQTFRERAKWVLTVDSDGPEGTTRAYGSEPATSANGPHVDTWGVNLPDRIVEA
jgi:hypothetical protein